MLEQRVLSLAFANGSPKTHGTSPRDGMRGRVLVHLHKACRNLGESEVLRLQSLCETLSGSCEAQSAARAGKAPGWFAFSTGPCMISEPQDFSRLHQEHREAIAGSCQIRCLAEGGPGFTYLCLAGGFHVHRFLHDRFGAKLGGGTVFCERRQEMPLHLSNAGYVAEVTSRSCASGAMVAHGLDRHNLAITIQRLSIY